MGDLGEARRARDVLVVIPCTAVASAGIGRAGRTRSASLSVSAHQRRVARQRARRSRPHPGSSRSFRSRRRHTPPVRGLPSACARALARSDCELTCIEHVRRVGRQSYGPSWLTSSAGTRTDTERAPAVPRRVRPALRAPVLRARRRRAARPRVAPPARPLAGDARRARLAGRKEIKWHGIRTGEVPPPLADAVVVAMLARSPCAAT